MLFLLVGVGLAFPKKQVLHTISLHVQILVQIRCFLLKFFICSGLWWLCSHSLHICSYFQGSHPASTKNTNIPNKKTKDIRLLVIYIIYRPEFWILKLIFLKFFWFYGRSAVFSSPCPFRRLGGKWPFTFDADGSVTTTLWLCTKKGRCWGRDCQIHIKYIYMHNICL